MRSYTIKRTLIGRLRQDTDLYDGISRIVLDNSVRIGRISGIGAVRRAAIAYYNQSEGRYEEIELDQPMEILALNGNISMKEGIPFAHLHVILGDRHGQVRGGHLLPGKSPVFACEIFVEEFDGPVLVRKTDSTTGLALWPTATIL